MFVCIEVTDWPAEILPPARYTKTIAPLYLSNQLSKISPLNWEFFSTGGGGTRSTIASINSSTPLPVFAEIFYAKYFFLSQTL